MLKRISHVKGIGLLHDADGRQHTLQKGALVYAENGRGKSTLASILRSVSTNDVDIINGRTTVDGTIAPEVELHFDSGHKVQLQSGAWSESRPELLVFDAEFIERNVHSGGTVNPTHRKNLLEFALGEGAVVARTQLDAAMIAAKRASDEVKGIEKELSGHHNGVSLAQFEAMGVIDKPDEKISGLRKRLEAATSIVEIKGRLAPSPIELPNLNLESLFQILGTALNDIHEDAERVVREHVEHIGDVATEHWISQGQGLEREENCPYCGQSLDGVELIKAYRTFFNAAYDELKKKVAVLEQGISVRTSDSIVEHFSAQTSAAQAQATAWQEQVRLEGITFDASGALKVLSQLREFLLDLARRKVMNPAEAIGTDAQKAEAVSLWEQLLQMMSQSNRMIVVATEAIKDYKKQLEAENSVLLKQEILCIELAVKRQAAAIVTHFSELNAARATARTAEKNKQKEKAKLDAIMAETLRKYEQAINHLLARFGAAFSIHAMSSNHRGGAPRSEYGLVLRGRPISIDRGTPSFATVLSEGDKRTLAFAFFVASVLADNNLAQKIVVIDDPMCSLDLNRKQQTRKVLKDIYSGAEQLVVLAHDIYFLRDLRDDLVKDGQPSVAVMQLIYAANNYTNFAGIDLDKECASKYYRDHRLLSDFVSGQAVGDARAVAKAIRPLLEGYLHRRFPGLLPKDQMFGGVVAMIRDSVQSSPLAYAQDLIDELNEINGYAGQFHHNTNPDAESAPLVHHELRVFAGRALNVLYQGAVDT